VADVVGLIPVFGLALLIVLCVVRGDSGETRFGPVSQDDGIGSIPMVLSYRIGAPVAAGMVIVAFFATWGSVYSNEYLGGGNYFRSAEPFAGADIGGGWGICHGWFTLGVGIICVILVLMSFGIGT
jgi:hypothetical protein